MGREEIELSLLNEEARNVSQRPSVRIGVLKWQRLALIEEKKQ